MVHCVILDPIVVIIVSVHSRCISICLLIFVANVCPCYTFKVVVHCVILDHIVVIIVSVHSRCISICLLIFVANVTFESRVSLHLCNGNDLISVGRRCSYIDGCCILYRALYLMLIIVFEVFVTLFFVSFDPLIVDLLLLFIHGCWGCWHARSS